MRNLYIAVGIVGFALGSIGILMLVAPSVPRSEPAKFRWSKKHPNVPDSYGPARDGPVWLGPYRFSPPSNALIGGSIPEIATFQFSIVGDQVSYFPGGMPPEGGWLTLNAIHYRGYSPVNSADIGASIIETRAPFTASWHSVREVRLQLPGIVHENGKPIEFICWPDQELFDKSLAAQSLDVLAQDETNGSCRTIVLVRPGVRVFFEFPMRHARIASDPVYKAFGFLLDSIETKQESPILESHF